MSNVITIKSSFLIARRKDMKYKKPPVGEYDAIDSALGESCSLPSPLRSHAGVRRSVLLEVGDQVNNNHNYLL